MASVGKYHKRHVGDGKKKKESNTTAIKPQRRKRIGQKNAGAKLAEHIPKH